MEDSMHHHRATKRAPLDFTAELKGRQGAPVQGRHASATEPRAKPVSDTGAAARSIANIATTLTGPLRFELSAGDAAELMFQIGYALERAAAPRSHGLRQPAQEADIREGRAMLVAQHGGDRRSIRHRC